MPALLELIVPVRTRDLEAEAVQAAVALVEPHVQGGAIVDATGYGEYGETDLVSVTVRGYVEDTAENLVHMAGVAAVLTTRLDADQYGEIVVRPLAEADWTEAWKHHFQPMRVGERLIISPTWAQPENGPEDIVVWLDPGLAFGTGGHPSTRLILRLLERRLHRGDRMLDVGTGSGILAIAAVKLGAVAVHGTDIDPVAVRVAAENIHLNGVEHAVTLATGSAPEAGQYELVVANILADVIADLLLREHLAERMTPGGSLLLAGIIRHRRHLVDLALAALNPSGLSPSGRSLEVVEEEHEGEWVGLVVRGV